MPQSGSKSKRLTNNTGIICLSLSGKQNKHSSTNIYYPKPWTYDSQYWNRSSRKETISNLDKIDIENISKKRKLQSPFDSLQPYGVCNHPKTHELSLDKQLHPKRKITQYWDYIKSMNVGEEQLQVVHTEKPIKFKLAKRDKPIIWWKQAIEQENKQVVTQEVQQLPNYVDISDDEQEDDQENQNIQQKDKSKQKSTNKK